jgi:hypothetical protein
MNSIVCVGDGDGLYGEQRNLSGDRQVSIDLRDLNPQLQAVLFYWLIPSVFHKTLSKYTLKNSFKMWFFYMSRAKYVHFLVCKLPNWISTLDSLHNSRLHFYFKIYSLKDISNFRYSNQKIITLVLTIYLATLHIPRRHLWKRKSWTIIGLFHVPLEFQPKMKNWIPKLLKCLFKQCYIAGSAKCSMKPLSNLLACILSVVKTRLQSYCDTNYSRDGVYQMWFLKNSSDLLEYMQYRSLSSCNSIKTFDFSTLYTTIPHSKLKDKLRELVQLCFIKKNGQHMYKYLVLGRDRSYFVKKH